MRALLTLACAITAAGEEAGYDCGGGVFVDYERSESWTNVRSQSHVHDCGRSWSCRALVSQFAVCLLLLRPWTECRVTAVDRAATTFIRTCRLPQC